MKKENKMTLLTALGTLAFISLLVFFSISGELEEQSPAKIDATENLDTGSYISYPKYQVIVNKLNVRAKPTTQSKIIAKLRCGDVVQATSLTPVKGKWIEVRVNDRVGYVYEPFVREGVIRSYSEVSLEPGNKIADISLRWWKGEIEDLHYFKMEVKNKSCFSLEDFEFKINEFAETGTLIRQTSYTAYKRVKPFSSRVLKFYILGDPQASGVNVQVKTKVVY